MDKIILEFRREKQFNKSCTYMLQNREEKKRKWLHISYVASFTAPEALESSLSYKPGSHYV